MGKMIFYFIKKKEIGNSYKTKTMGKHLKKIRKPNRECSIMNL
jgi:hypothetical protein